MRGLGSTVFNKVLFCSVAIHIQVVRFKYCLNMGFNKQPKCVYMTYVRKSVSTRNDDFQMLLFAETLCAAMGLWFENFQAGITLSKRVFSSSLVGIII